MNKIEEYIEKQKSSQKEILKELRKIILNTLPNIKEEFKNGVPWYGKYYLVGLKDHVNIGFSIYGLTNAEMNLFEGNGKLMRHIEIYSLKDIDEKKIVNLLRLVQKSHCDSSCG